MKENIKKSIENYLKWKSKAYSKLYMLFLEFWTFYFKKEAEKYIKSLDKMPELKKIGEENEFLEDIEKLLEQAYLLGQTEEIIRSENNLKNYGYSVPENIVISSEKAREYAENHAWELIKWIDETSQKEVSTIISMGLWSGQTKFQIAEKIQETFEKFSLYRANLITHMELATAYSKANRSTADEYHEKLWVVGWKRALTQKDDNVRTSHKENEKVGWIPKNEEYPYATLNKTPPFDFNCRCSESYSAVNPNTGKLYDNPFSEAENTENKIKNFENSLKEIGESFGADFSQIPKKKNRYINLLNTLSLINDTFPWKRDGQSSVLKKNIYALKYGIIGFMVQNIFEKKIKWYYRFSEDTLPNGKKMGSVAIKINSTTIKYHLPFKEMEKIEKRLDLFWK